MCMCDWCCPMRTENLGRTSVHERMNQPRKRSSTQNFLEGDLPWRGSSAESAYGAKGLWSTCTDLRGAGRDKRALFVEPSWCLKHVCNCCCCCSCQRRRAGLAWPECKPKEFSGSCKSIMSTVSTTSVSTLVVQHDKDCVAGLLLYRSLGEGSE